jgi:hypothetical protein
MKRLPVVLALVVAPLLARAELAFPVPAGWLDVSPGAPEANFANLPPQLVETLRSGKMKAFAFDVAHASDGFTPNFNAVAVDRRLRVTQANRDEAVRTLFEGIQAQAPGARLVEHDIIEISGVNALRMVYDAEPGGMALRQMAVVVPGVPESAVVTYTALRTQFPALRSSFEAHAASIRGAEASRGVLAAGGRGAVIGAIVGALVGGVAMLVRRRRRSA